MTEITKNSVNVARGWAPLIVLPLAVMAARGLLPPWGLMWALAFAIFLGCKWASLEGARAARRRSGLGAGLGRSLGYLLLWPGMDANSFLNPEKKPPRPKALEWAFAASKTALGVGLLWGLSREIPPRFPLLVGWTGLFGLVFLLHFGLFHLAALSWQAAGVAAEPIQRAPILAASLRDFWGVRWNRAFHQLAQEHLYRPLSRVLGPSGAALAAFLASGLVHELVISFPAGGGYGLPAGYFALQGTGLLVERRLGIGSRRLPGWTGRLAVLLVAGIPALGLFHPPFLNRVILPFLQAIGAIGAIRAIGA